jgi:hypothetical protein
LPILRPGNVGIETARLIRLVTRHVTNLPIRWERQPGQCVLTLV